MPRSWAGGGRSLEENLVPPRRHRVGNLDSEVQRSCDTSRRRCWPYIGGTQERQCSCRPLCETWRFGSGGQVPTCRGPQGLSEGPPILPVGGLFVCQLAGGHAAAGGKREARAARTSPKAVPAAIASAAATQIMAGGLRICVWEVWAALQLLTPFALFCSSAVQGLCLRARGICDTCFSAVRRCGATTARGC